MPLCGGGKRAACADSCSAPVASRYFATAMVAASALARCCAADVLLAIEAAVMRSSMESVLLTDSPDKSKAPPLEGATIPEPAPARRRAAFRSSAHLLALSTLAFSGKGLWLGPARLRAAVAHCPSRFARTLSGWPSGNALYAAASSASWGEPLLPESCKCS